MTTGAEGSLDAELAETILATSGMEGGLVSYSVGLFSALRTSISGRRRVCRQFEEGLLHLNVNSLPSGMTCHLFFRCEAASLCSWLCIQTVLVRSHATT